MAGLRAKGLLMQIYGSAPNADGRSLTVYADAARLCVSITDPTLGALGYEMTLTHVTPAQAQGVLNTIRQAMQTLWPSVS